ncbi:MAG: DUF4956 domain-containing protein [Paludibacter sp.]|jgi:hypothetical protein|nr:DUF4956 domain-containing protein [Bacteroidales bacterium]
MRKSIVTLMFMLLLGSVSLFTGYSNVHAFTRIAVSETEDLVDEELMEETGIISSAIQIDSTFFINLGINLLGVILIILLVYYPNYKKMDTIFTFLMFNIVIFLLTFVLNEVKMSMGAAFGLFAIFSMLRYRTASINTKEMTYLFIFIAMGLISAIRLQPGELGIIIGIVFLSTLILDTGLILKKESSNEMRYEKVDMIKPEKREALLADLSERTGLNVHRISIQKIDYLRDTAMITYYYYEK